MNQDPGTRRDESRRLATDGLTEREIAERLGVSQPTVHRDLEGWERPPSPEEIDAVIAENPRQYGPASARLLIAQRRKAAA